MTDTPADTRRIEFKLVVWTAPGQPWRGRGVAADDAERDFANPFSLSRVLASPALPPRRARGEGMRAKKCRTAWT